MLIKLIETLVKKLVDQPDRVQINQITGDNKVIIEVRVASQDLSRLIGSEGRTFRALRAVVHLLSPDYKDLVIDTIQE